MNKNVLVTGSAKGIGKAIILEFADHGYNCVINYLSSYDEAMSLKEEILKKGVKCLAIKCDVSKENDVDLMFNKIEKELGGIDILVNNAGIDMPNLFNLKTADEFRKVLDTNVVGAYNTSKRAYKYMLNNKWGRIINISSTNGMNTYYPMCFDYDASKAALNSLTHNLSYQFSPYINVNAVAPGFIGTEAELDGYDEEFLKQETDKIFVKRYGNPEDVAHLVFFLSTDEASFINNQIIKIDGGQYGD